MAEGAFLGTCVHCAELLANVPLSVLLITLVATLAGLSVLVCLDSIDPRLYRCAPGSPLTGDALSWPRDWNSNAN